MEKETYKIEIGGKEYILKKKLSGREEHLCGIKKFFSDFMSDKQDKDEIVKLVFSDDFHETSLKMIGFLLEYPKLTEDEIFDLDSDILLSLKMETLIQYAESFKSLQAYMEKKKLTTLKPSAMDFSNSLETNPQEVYDTLASQRKSNLRLK